MSYNDRDEYEAAALESRDDEQAWHDQRVDAARARMIAAWKWPERSTWIDVQRLLPQLEHAAIRAGWPAPRGSQLRLLTPANANTPACIRWTNDTLAAVPGGSRLAATPAASRLIIVGRIEAYDTLGDIVEDTYATHANVTPLRKTDR